VAVVERHPLDWPTPGPVWQAMHAAALTFWSVASYMDNHEICSLLSLTKSYHTHSHSRALAERATKNNHSPRYSIFANVSRNWTSLPVTPVFSVCAHVSLFFGVRACPRTPSMHGRGNRCVPSAEEIRSGACDPTFPCKLLLKQILR
jgi:hypothetical protein